MECLEKVGMADYADRQISQLSGGQQQRIFLARALAQDAQLYFMDEPFVGVDAATEKAIITLLNELKMLKKTVLVVHHDLATVKEYFDWVMLLNLQIIAYGPTEQTFTTEKLQETYATSGFVGTLISASGNNLPTGPLTVLMATLLFVISLLFAPRRGVLSKLLLRASVRNQIKQDDTLLRLEHGGKPL